MGSSCRALALPLCVLALAACGKGASTPIPAGPPSCGRPRPGPANTGVPAGTRLTPSGSITVDTPGAVVQDLDVAGTITVLADDVTIRRVRVTSGDYYPIRYFDNDNRGLVKDLTIECSYLSGGGWTLNIRGTGATVPRNTRIVDNRFGRDAGYGPITIDDPAPIVTGNVWDDDGTPLAW